MSQKTNKITIIGGGNLGSAIAYGLKRSNFIKPSAIHIAELLTEKLNTFEEAGFLTSSNNQDAAKNASVVLLAVKPWQIADVLEDILPVLTKETLLVSLAAGVTFEDLSPLVRDRPIFRVIPNTAVAIGESMTCISGQNTSKEQNKIIEEIFQQVGEVLFLPENLMAAATVIASCGTAFALRYLRASAQGGVESGFTSKEAVRLAAQTMKGAAEIILSSNNHPEEEIDKVTTPGGITIKGLNEMEHNGFSSSIIKGMMAALDQIRK